MSNAPNEIYLTKAGNSDDDYLWCENKVDEGDVKYERAGLAEENEEKSEADLLLLSKTIAENFLVLDKYRFMASNIYSDGENKKQIIDMHKGLYRALYVLSASKENTPLYKLYFKALENSKLEKTG